MTGCEHGVDYLTLIAPRKQKDALCRLLLGSGCHLIEVVYAKGSLKYGYFKDMLGMVPEEKKVMITCLVAGNRSEGIFIELKTKFEFDKPNTGIAFIVPVSKLSVNCGRKT